MITKIFTHARCVLPTVVFVTIVHTSSAQVTNTNIIAFSILQNPQVLAGTNILAPTDKRYEVFTSAIGWGNTNNLLALNQTDTPIAATNAPRLQVTGLKANTVFYLDALLWYSALNPSAVMAYSYTSSTNAVGGAANFVRFGDRLTNIPTGNPAALWFALSNAVSDSSGNLDIYLGAKDSPGYSGWDKFNIQALQWVWNNAATNMTWNTASTNWAAARSASTNWVNGNVAVFGATGAGTVTVSGTNTVSELNVTADGYTFTGGALALGNASTIFAISNATEIASTITGTNALAKTGAGTLTLAGANTYSGGSTVEAGKLVVNGSISGVTTVRSGATLGGSGTIAGHTTIYGTLSP